MKRAIELQQHVTLTIILLFLFDHLQMPYVNLYDSLSRNDDVSTLIDYLDKQEFGDPV